MKSKFHLYQPAILAIGAALLLCLAWRGVSSLGLIFIGLIPILLLERHTANHQKSLLFYGGYIWLFSMIWHLGTCYYLFNTGVWKILIGMGLNSLLQAIALVIPFMLFRKKSYLWRMAGFVFFWIGFEYLHQSWELAFPLLSLGTALASLPVFIQWYEFTGVLGGTLWVLLINVLLLEAYVNGQKQARLFRQMYPVFVPVLAVLILPILISIGIHSTHKEVGEEVEVLAIHPNMDCHEEKYTLPQDTLIARYLSLTFDGLSPQTQYILWPESAIPDGGWIEGLQMNPLFELLKDTLKSFPHTHLVTGAINYKSPSTWRKDLHSSPLISYSEELGTHFLTHTTALHIHKDLNLSFRSKQNLVAFEETLPYPKYSSFLKGIVKGSLGDFYFSKSKTNQNVFVSHAGLKTSTLLCYEAAFGEQVRKYVNKGAELLFVLLNEGWYKNLYGAKQAERMSIIRAIETRRAVARSSNKGISSFINQRGDVIQAESRFEAGFVKASLSANSQRTFFTRYGGLIGYIGAYGSVILFLIFFPSLLFNRAYHAKQVTVISGLRYKKR